MVWLITGVAVLLAAAGCAFAAVRARYVVVTVDGISMLPSLRHGDRLLAVRRRPTRIRNGEIVVLRRPGADGDASGGAAALAPGPRWYVKRAVALPGDPVPAELAAQCPLELGTTVPPERLLVLGDNGRSDDSRQHGYFPASSVLGVVVRRL